MTELKFENIKNDVLAALNKIEIDVNESLTLLEGFVNTPFASDLALVRPHDGPSIPMIALLGNKSGRIHPEAYHQR